MPAGRGINLFWTRKVPARSAISGLRIEAVTLSWKQARFHPTWYAYQRRRSTRCDLHLHCRLICSSFDANLFDHIVWPPRSRSPTRRLILHVENQSQPIRLPMTFNETDSLLSIKCVVTRTFRPTPQIRKKHSSRNQAPRVDVKIYIRYERRVNKLPRIPSQPSPKVP